MSAVPYPDVGDVLLATTTQTSGTTSSMPWGVIAVLLLIAFVIVAVLWMVTGASSD